ncbi:MAG: hypothetical protein R2804_12845 [Cyclobacteriaceae bacterium]
MYRIGLIGLLVTSFASAQNIDFESQRSTFYRYPLHPLDKSLKTYSVSIQELGSFLDKQQKDTLLERAMVLPGFERVKAGGDVQIELIMNPLSINNKELKDEPRTNEKDGVKTTFHQYWYEISYNFPTRIRLLARGEVITEQDLPGFYTTQYYPQNRNSLSGIQKEYDNDFHFRNVLLGKRLDERKREIRDWLFSNYGYGFEGRLIDVATVKDKKGEYPDISKGLSLMIAAIKSTDQKKDYIDENFSDKLRQAIALYEKELKEFSPDKKARINEKVKNMLHFNIALAQYLMRDFDEAEQSLTLVNPDIRGLHSNPYRLKEDIQDTRMRLVANGLMKGELPPPMPKPQPVEVIAPKPSTKYRDYIVFVNGDTVDVQFVMPSRDLMPYGDSLWLQDRVIVIEDEKSIEILAKDIMAYSFQGVDRETYSKVVDTSTMPFTIEYRMCQRTATGTISLYRCHEVAISFSDPSKKFVKSVPYYKKGDKFEVAVYGNFNRGVSKLVSDYPELSTRVKNGEFVEGDLVKVVNEYNAWVKK